MPGWPIPTDNRVSSRMARQRRVDTDPELQLRRILHRAGLRYRVNMAVPGRPRRRMDIGFPRVRVAVFVDGCFWHVCPEHASWPANNAEWWRAKLEGNEIRDRDTDEALATAGWRVVRVWEHEPASLAAARVVEMIARRDRPSA